MSSPFFANHNARTSRVNRDAGIFSGALDDDARDRSVFQLGLEVVAYFDVFGKHACEVTVGGVPAAGPVAADGEAKAGRMNFLSHILFAFQLPTVTYTWHVGLLMRLPRPLARAVKRLSVVPCST